MYSERMSKKYSIGELAESLGISVQAVRYYESIGLIRSERNKKNGYREYSIEASQILYQTSIYKAMGFSLEEIRKLIYAESMNAITESVGNKKKEIEQEIRRLQYLNEEMEYYLSEAGTIGSQKGTLEMEDIPFYAVFATTKQDELVSSSDVLHSAQKNVPFLRQSFTFHADELDHEQMEYRYGIAIRKKWGESLFDKNELSPYLYVLKAPVYRKIIHRTVNHFEKEMFREMMNEIQELGYEPDSDFFGISLLQSFSQKHEGYFEFIVSLRKN